MLIEAAKGGHTNVVSYLLDYPNNILSVPAPDLSQLTPPSQDASQVNTRVKGKNYYLICIFIESVWRCDYIKLLFLLSGSSCPIPSSSHGRAPSGA